MTSINFERLKEILDEYLKPRWDGKISDWPLRYGGGETYIQETILKKASPLLSENNLLENPRKNLIDALQKHKNLLSVFEGMKAKEFLIESDEKELRINFIDLLYGKENLNNRLKSFLEWSKLRDFNGKNIGIKPIVASYFLAVSNPPIYAFCKPGVYSSAVKELLGEQAIVKDKVERLIHCSAFYKEILAFLEINYGLKDGNLFDVHSILWSLKSGFDGTGDSLWGRLNTKTNYLIFSYKDGSPWDDKFGESYHYGVTVPNHKKVKIGAKFLLLNKKIGFVGFGEIGDIKSDNDQSEFHAQYKSFNAMEPPIELTAEIRADIESIEGYNIQHSIKVINENIYDKIIGKSKKTSSWIFQANPKIYDIESALKVLKKINWSVRQHKDKIKSGDTVFIWQSGLNASILAFGSVITGPGELQIDKSEEPFVIMPAAFQKEELSVKVEITSVLRNPIKKEILLNHSILSGLTLFKAPQGTNFPITEEQAKALNELIENRPPLEIYTKEAALKDLFVSEQDFDYVMSRLKSKKNIILQGPPGVGKTFIAKRLAYYLMGGKDDTRISMVQFHQSYSYEDFIQGFRPNGDGKFTLRNGLFYEFCHQAIKDPNNKYIFIIDEINRGNLSKIFGEMLMLIESDKRGEQFAVALTYGKGNSDKFYIPENLHLIGTMNTADRSLAMVDYALRRRFSFIDLEPQFKNSKFRQLLTDAGIQENLITLIIDRMQALNQTISEDSKNLGPGYCIGHSYFCPTGNEISYDESWYRMVIRSEVEPLLREYWFDDPKRVADNAGKLLAGIPE